MTDPSEDRTGPDCCRSRDTVVHEHRRPTGVGDAAPEPDGYTDPQADSGTAWSVEL